MINDDSSTPMMYVINYENNGGFVLVSATKDYYPILAYSDTGNFNTNLPNPGVSEWQDLMMTEIRNSHSQPADSIRKFHRIWSKYNNYELPKMTKNPSTRSLTNDELWELRMVIEDSINSWNRQGFQVYDLNHNFFDTEQEYQEMIDGVHYGMYPEYIDNYADLSVIVAKTITYKDIKVDNFVKTTWNQGPNYNKYFPFQTSQKAPAGCVPVALGQVLRYYCYPLSYSWINMPLNYASDETARLLYDIAQKLDAKYSDTATSANFEKIQDVLTDFGYDYTFYDGDNPDIEANCIAKKPILTRGIEKGANAGHAWVISGYDYSYTCSQYEIWTFTNYKSLGIWNTYRLNHSSHEYQYMNWGWGGLDNGYYIYPKQFTENRKYIYNITPRAL